MSLLARATAAACCAAALVAAPIAHADTVLLQNDTFAGGASTCAADDGFTTSRAAGFMPAPEQLPFKIDAIEVLACGSGEVGTYSVTLYQDDLDATAVPGPPIFSSTGSFELVGDGTLQRLDLRSEDLIVSGGGVRVALTNLGGSPVGIGEDTDGIVAMHDFRQAADGTWSFAEDTGDTGDFVIRLVVVPGAPGPVSVGDVSVAEGDRVARFRISMAAPANVPVRVGYATNDGSAVSGDDYQPAEGVATIEAGRTSTVVRVRIRDDVVAEQPERFLLRIVPESNATIADAVGKATVIDDDG
jgi:hypothetical protein